MVRRDGAGIRLLTRRGHDWSDRFPLIRISAAALPVRSCLIDGEAVCCDEDGIAVFQKLRIRRDNAVFLYAFDLLELDGWTSGVSRLRAGSKRSPTFCIAKARLGFS